MKNIIFAGLFFSLIFTSCSKRKSAAVDLPQDLRANYDTAAVDSFSAGATSVDVVNRIRASSQAYQDSIKNALKTQAEEKQIREELEKENKKKQEEEKKKAEEKKRANTENISQETKGE